MNFEEYLEYIVNKFKVELADRWTVEIRHFYSEYDGEDEIKRVYNGHSYLHITNGHWSYCYEVNGIKQKYLDGWSVAQVYRLIKDCLESDYRRTLWKNS